MKQWLRKKSTVEYQKVQLRFFFLLGNKTAYITFLWTKDLFLSYAVILTPSHSLPHIHIFQFKDTYDLGFNSSTNF
jgi:hypothetical protein